MELRRLAMWGKLLAVTFLTCMTNLSQADVPTPYYGSTVNPVVSDLAKKCSIPTDSVSAVSPSQYNSLVSDVRNIYNLSWWLHDNSRKYYNKMVSDG